MTLVKVRDTHQIRIERNGPDVAFVLDGLLVFQARHAERVGKALLEAAMALPR